MIFMQKAFRTIIDYPKYLLKKEGITDDDIIFNG